MRYPKIGRGFWRVSPMPHRSWITVKLWDYAHAIARSMNYGAKPEPETHTVFVEGRPFTYNVDGSRHD